jgi:iron complex outermembrane receptor protein
MKRAISRSMFGATTALGLVHAASAFAQTTPGDATGTPAAAGTGQSAATSTNAPARPAVMPAADESSSDIIVTARRVEERLQDVPISITVFNQQQISNRNLVNAQDLANYTPSLSTNSNFGNEFSSFALRGFVQDPSTAPSVGVYFADVVALRGPTQGTQAGDGAGPGSFFDLQNVQVLKGPQGTLFGRNTTGGAVLFVPQKPTSRTEGYVEGSYGNYDMKRVQGAVNIPLGEAARLRIAGDYLNRDGWQKNRTGIGPVGYNDVNYYALRGSLVLDLTPNLENYTIVSYTHSDTNGSSKKQIACVPTSSLGALFACPQQAREAAAGYGFYDFSSNEANPRSRITSWQAINTTTWRASDTLTIKNIASYGQLTVFQRSPLFGNDWILPALFGPLAGQRITGVGVINPAPNREGVEQSTFTEELQFQGDSLGGKLTWQAGGYFELSDPLGTIGSLSPVLLACSNIPALACLNPLRAGALNLTLGRTQYRNIGTYAQATYSLTDQLKLTGGIRYTWDRTTNTSTKVTYSPTPTGVGSIGRCTDTLGTPANQIYDGAFNCTARLVQKSDKPTWLIDLDYKPVDDLLLYAKYSRGYRSGGISPNLPVDTRVFEPEKVDAYEGGLKATFRGAIDGTFNVAGFYNDFSNQQIQAGFLAAPGRAVSPTAGPINAGKSRIYGAEVESSITPFRGFTVDASYTYLRTKIRSIAEVTSADPNYIVSFQIRPGNPLPLSPRNKLSVGAHYTLPLDESIGRITFGGTFTHTDKQLTTYQYINSPALQAQLGNLGTIPGYNLVAVDLQWKSIFRTPVDLSLFGTNVTKKKYLSYVTGLTGAGFETAVLGEPRMYGLRLRYHFGG